MTKLLGQRPGTDWAGWTGEHKCRAYPSRLQLLLAAKLASRQSDTNLAILSWFLSPKDFEDL